MAHLLSNLFNAFQTVLFPILEEQYSNELTDKEQQFIRVAEVCAFEKYLELYTKNLMGRPKTERLAIISAFVAKAVYNIPTTKHLIENLKRNSVLRRLCGWEAQNQIPSESTFSRAFAEFANSALPSKIHEAMVKTYYGDKIAGHISRDSTPIDAREKPVKIESEKKEQKKFKKGRPKKDEVRPAKQPEVLKLQITRTLEENLAQIPTCCAVGAKADSKGYKKTWIGYKMHADVIDGDIPISIIVSSASTHDSQVSIPLAQMSSQRVVNLYDLMDAAYDATEIKEFSKRLSHVPLIDSNPRRGEKIEFDPAEKIRYNQRSSAERLMSNLKDNHGGKSVRVRGVLKVTAHLMFGILAITAEQLLKLTL